MGNLGKLEGKWGVGSLEQSTMYKVLSTESPVKEGASFRPSFFCTKFNHVVFSEVMNP